MRNRFINKLTELAESHEDIFLICGDLGYSVLESFRDQFPDRFLNAGIAEQNMTAVAVGLAREGYNVFTYSIGNFPTLRCMEQIRYDVCYHDSNVKIISVGAGYAYGPQGVSHHTTEDIGMLRTLPNIDICSPADPIEAMLAADYMVSKKGPGYVRLSKSGEENIHKTTPRFTKGSLIQILEGEKLAIIATGSILASIKTEVKNNNKNWALFSSPFIGNYGTNQIIEICNSYKTIVTVEEHQLNCGFGSSIVEHISDLYSRGVLLTMPFIKRIAIDNLFIDYCGDQEFLRKSANLNLSRLID